jgi:hypothetical protein
LNKLSEDLSAETCHQNCVEIDRVLQEDFRDLGRNSETELHFWNALQLLWLGKSAWFAGDFYEACHYINKAHKEHYRAPSVIGRHLFPFIRAWQSITHLSYAQECDEKHKKEVEPQIIFWAKEAIKNGHSQIFQKDKILLCVSLNSFLSPEADRKWVEETLAKS